MKLKLFAGLALAACMFTACDDTTDEIGASLTNNVDLLSVSVDTFNAVTRSIAADSVISRFPGKTVSYLGKFKDPETGTYVTSSYTSQFRTLTPDVLEGISDIEGMIADSCDIRLYYDEVYGDSLAPMRVNVMELSKPIPESADYYSNFDPEKEGYIRKDGINKSRVYSLKDLTAAKPELSDSILIRLNDEYTDADGKTYSNYGAYILEKYKENPANFSDPTKFIYNVTPGFYFKQSGGIGSMAKIYLSQLNVYFHYNYNNSSYHNLLSFAGTQEVLQTSNFVNDKEGIDRLVADNNCTYLKTPSGIFTEITLPVEEIMESHSTDTLNTVKIQFNRYNDEYNGDYAIKYPKTLLMIPADSLNSFFENKSLPDYKTSYIANIDTKALSSTKTMDLDTYTFNNIEGMVKAMHKESKKATKSANWNKAVLIPVVLNTVAIGQSTYPASLYHNMSMTSTRLVGGKDPIKVTVIYSKFKE